MKTAYIIINIFLILNINSCLAQDNKPKKDTIIPKTNTMNRPQLINDSFEKLNLNDFKELVIKKERIEVDLNKWEDVDTYEYSKESKDSRVSFSGSYTRGFRYFCTEGDFIYAVNIVIILRKKCGE